MLSISSSPRVSIVLVQMELTEAYTTFVSFSVYYVCPYSLVTKSVLLFQPLSAFKNPFWVAKCQLVGFWMDTLEIRTLDKGNDLFASEPNVTSLIWSCVCQGQVTRIIGLFMPHSAHPGSRIPGDWLRLRHTKREIRQRTYLDTNDKFQNHFLFFSPMLASSYGLASVVGGSQCRS